MSDYIDKWISKLEAQLEGTKNLLDELRKEKLHKERLVQLRQEVEQDITPEP